MVTDGLRSYPAAMRELGNLDRREVGRWLNNRAENSHPPFRRMKTLQKFASVHASFHNHVKHPPTSTRFAKGQSRNPRRLPKNRRREVPYHRVLGQMVTIREEGR
jgi:transposase-like protein